MIKQSWQTGFTLLELMVALAIIGILAAVTYPAYQGYTQRSHRSEAKVVLQGIAAGLEQCALHKGAYDHTDCNSTDKVFNLDSSAVAAARVYSFTLPSASLAADSYVILATPLAGGRMAGDGKLILYSDGRSGWDKDNDGSYSGTFE